VEWEAPRQLILLLIEFSLSIATFYGVRGIRRREAVRPLGRMARGG